VPYYTYDSDSTYDRTWPDGHVDYICRFCYDHGRGEVVFAKPGHIGTHWAQHIRDDDAPKAGGRKVLYRRDGQPAGINQSLRDANAARKARGEPVRKPKPGTKAFREAALAETIANAVEESRQEAGTAVTAEADRYNKARGVVDLGGVPAEVAIKGTPEQAIIEMGPLTDDQKLMAIRTILDDGEMALLTLTNQQLREQNQALQDRVDKLQGDLQALKEILGGIS
jgi:hypothetical protein